MGWYVAGNRQFTIHFTFVDNNIESIYHVGQERRYKLLKKLVFSGFYFLKRLQDKRLKEIRKNSYLYIWNTDTLLFLTVLMLLINMIAKDWIKTKIEKERNVMLRQARISRVLAMCGGLMILSTLIFGMIFPLCFGWTIRYVTNLTDPGKPLIIQTYYIYDMTKSPQFELTLMVQGIGLILSGLTYTGVDTFLGLLVLHICGQMENLHIRLANLEKDTNYKAILKYNVKDHVRLIRFSS